VGCAPSRVERIGQVHDALAAALAHDGLALVDAYEKGGPKARTMARSLLEPFRLGTTPAVSHAETRLRHYT
jgi:hypothetical protein